MNPAKWRVSISAMPSAFIAGTRVQRRVSSFPIVYLFGFFCLFTYLLAYLLMCSSQNRGLLHFIHAVLPSRCDHWAPLQVGPCALWARSILFLEFLTKNIQPEFNHGVSSDKPKVTSLSSVKIMEGQNGLGIQGQERPQEIIQVGPQTGSCTRKRISVSCGENSSKLCLLEGVILSTLIF